MWEAGVATDGKCPDRTRTVVVYCQGEKPRVFGDMLMVDARNLKDVQNLVNQFLTREDFFPIRDKPISGHTAKSDPIKNRAKTLFDELQQVLPPRQAPETWPAWPWMKLELSDEATEELLKAAEDSASEGVLQEARIVRSDPNCARLIGKRSLSDVRTLKDFYDIWLSRFEDHDGVDLEWAVSLGHQVIQAARDDLPQPQWRVLVSEDKKASFLPLLVHINVLPAERCRRFDVYFPRMHVEGENVAISLPNDPGP